MRHLGLWVATVSCLAAPATLDARQQASLRGIVQDSTTHQPVAGASLTVTRGDSVIARTVSDSAGRFAISSLRAGRYVAEVSRIGYRAKRAGAFDLGAGENVLILIQLVPLPLTIDAVVVSASRTEEKALEAPASISVVSRQQVADRPSLTIIDHVYGLPGIDVEQTGITQHEVVARGFNNVASGALLTLTDYRYAALPSLRINTFNFIPLADEDIERIEIVRGPGAALYGPNAANGVLHVITRSPLSAAGTDVSLAGGERSLLHASFRHAPANDGTVGFKISGQYLRADDWAYQDPTEVSNRTIALAQGADADTLLIGRRDERVERLAGEGRVDFRAGESGLVSATVGINEAINNVDLTPLGAAQVRDWRYSYAQLRLSRRRLFAQTFVNKSDAGETFLLRTGQPIVDHSIMWVTQLQNGSQLASANWTYGLDVQHTVPKTGGTITGRNENDDTIDEVGAYLHGERSLGARLDAVAALRVDYHNRLPNLVFSPRAALVWNPVADHHLRLTYNRAFSTPTTNDLFLDLFADSLRAPNGRALPFAVRVSGVPETGFSFRRDCGGPCMRSPFTPQSLGGPGGYIPVDAIPLWGAIIDTLRAAGLDLSAIPVPQPGDIQTQLFLLDGLTGQRRPLGQLQDIPPLKPAITNTFELGYKGVVAGRLAFAIDVYRSRIENFVGPLKIETPSAFLDSTSVANYLANYLPLDSARTLANLAQQLPVGTLTPVEARDPWDLLITYRNFGAVSLWGADLEATVMLNAAFSVRGTYSWVSDDYFRNLGGISDVALNAPASRGAATLIYQNGDRGINAELRGRFVAGYPINSGVYVDSVAAFTVVDAVAGIRLRRDPDLVLTVSAQNLFDNRHQEFVGAPKLGRLVMVRMRAGF